MKETPGKLIRDGWYDKMGMCPVCWNHVESDGSCLTCRLEKKCRELEEEVEKYKHLYYAALEGFERLELEEGK